MESQYLKNRRDIALGIKEEPVKEKPKRIPKVTPAQRKEKRKLKKAYEIYLAKPENRLCNIQADEGCTIQATVVNHTRRRGQNVMNEKDWEPSCTNCNNAVETKDAWARANGHLKSKFNNQ